MNILVTGGAGFIGRRTVALLCADGHRVRVLDRLDPQVHGAAAEPAGLDPRAEFVRGDVTDPATVDACLDGVEAVFHLAALTGVGQSMYDLRDYAHHTVTGTATLLERLLKRGQRLRRFVLSSSRAVYGEGAARCPRHGVVAPAPRRREDCAAGDFGLRCPACGAGCEPCATAEDQPPAPGSIYAWTKLQQEELVRHAVRHHGLEAAILRYFNVYGEGQALANPYTGVVAVFCARLRAGRPLALYERDLPLRDFVHVADVAEANRATLAAAVEPGTAINIGVGSALRISQVARALAAAMGVEARLEDTGEFRCGDILACWADRGRARALLGWEPRVGLEEGMRRFAAWAAGERAVDLSERAAAELRAHGLLGRAPAAQAGAVRATSAR
ncbi:MAG: SDR family NAD(P)-dependent oxidoreductase [Planctomycetes bacterium]|nr:SDR family NAD(P)-dependent oxidoreductase [Planctomycetota bacterium]